MTHFIHACNTEISGSGSEYLVLAHGLGTDKSVWDALVPALSSRYRVVRYDLACAGTAEPEIFDARRHAKLEGYADDLLTLLKLLGIGRCTFVGHSMSGMIGVLASIARPAAFERLVLIGASPRYINEPGYCGGFDASELGRMLDALERDFAAWAASFAPVAVARPLGDPATQTFLGTLRRMRPDIAILTWKMVLETDYRGILAECRSPAAILQMRDDPAVAPQAARFLHARLAGSVLEILDGAGHIPQLSAPAALADALRRHLPRFVRDDATHS